MNERENTDNLEAKAIEEDAPAVVAEEPVAAVAEPAIVEEPKPKPRTTNAVATHVVSGKDKDDVFLKQAVFKNPRARKSLTIHHLQRRLAELGYADAAADRDGWYGDLTKLAVEAWQKDNKVEPTGLMNAKTLEGIFAGDPNVRVNTD
jgi:peptidoglycan hydrolase-like protein with peptidoglycan-binding domain